MIRPEIMPKQRSPALTLVELLHTWWPLAGSWLLMGLELPAISAIMARLAEPRINLAAYGGIVFPLALIIEAPIIMLLAASTALSKDWQSYLKLRKFMLAAGGLLTFLHFLVAFTPLYYFLADILIGAPRDIIEPARIGLMIMLPWTWAIAYRRFNQGVLIRFGHSASIGVGTLFRLGTNGLVLAIGYSIGSVPGIIVATSAVAAGVTSEAVYTAIRVQPVLNNELKFSVSPDPPLTRKSFFQFYIPLALTSLITLLSQPIVSSALARMPRALDSLAVWPVISGLLFLIRSAGVAYNEVVVAHLESPRSIAVLRRFTGILAGATTFLLILINSTPLADAWFHRLSALDPSLTSLARAGLWFGLLVPGATALQSWFQGIILHSRKTRGIPEAVAAFLLVTIATYILGILRGWGPGLLVGTAGFSMGMTVQAGWLYFRSRPAVQSLLTNDLKS
jgi:hypothetical protein